MNRQRKPNGAEIVSDRKERTPCQTAPSRLSKTYIFCRVQLKMNTLNIEQEATSAENILTPANDFWMFSLARAMSCRMVLAPTSLKDKIIHQNIESNFSDSANPNKANQQLPVLVPPPARTHSFAHRSTFLPDRSEVCQTRSSPEPESPLMSWCYSR